ncbi:MAG TPA: hydantoinase B/oxoprolinase family protein [Blastocatellia bacterium]|nr:hydantoinase B/oxoprolinase family protein [Blastocatellia bacterium]
MPTKADPVKLEIFKSLYSSVAEEMGRSLRRSAFSPNIKERRDYSCAVFNRGGMLIAQGDHMPVHLGSMPMSVRAALEAVELGPGDVVVLNDPYAGGTHLPDVTMVSAVYGRSRGAGIRGQGKEKPLRNARRNWHNEDIISPRPLFFVANRAHHADIGGATPGSMGRADEIYQEGLRIPPVRLMIGGQINDDVMRLIYTNVRIPEEREGDLTAQLGAIATGRERLLEIVERYGFKEADQYATHLINYTAEMMRRVIRELPDGVYEAEDFLDDDGYSNEPVRIRARVEIKGERATVDFTGSAPQVRGPVNAVEAITVSATYYVFRCLIPTDVPASWGILDPIRVIAPVGTVVNARPPAPVAGGNVETSQRIVDTLLLALSKAGARVPAASQGTMNNLTIGGTDMRNLRDEAAHDVSTPRQFAYYETVAGGMGARPTLDGIDAIHTHMTNSLNTPAEAMEYAYPMRVRRYSIRRGSGGKGKHRGGDGVVREIELLTDARVTILSDRRKTRPYGLAGGEPGAPGRTILITKEGERELEAKDSTEARAGDRVRIETPGGGGYGSVGSR